MIEQNRLGASREEVAVDCPAYFGGEGQVDERWLDSLLALKKMTSG